MLIYQYLTLILITLYSCVRATTDFYKNHDAKYVEEVMRLAKGYEMRNNLNESVDPCENFYDYACGKWIKLNPAKLSEKLFTGFFETITDALDRKILKALETTADDNDNLYTDIDWKMKNLYNSCTNIKLLNSTYRQKLYDIIAEFGEMPLLTNNWNETNFDWLDTIGRIYYKYGITIIIGGEPLVDYMNNTQNKIYVGHPTFPLESQAIYLNEDMEEYREAYVKTITRDLEVFLGVNKTLAAKTAKEIFNFEIELAVGIEDSTAVTQMDDICILIDVNDLTEKYTPDLDVKRLINISLGRTFHGTVYEVYEDYQKNLIAVLQRTPKRTIANYIFYMLIADFILKEAKTPKKQHYQCVTYMKKHFAKVLDNMIYRKYIKNHTELEVLVTWYKLKQTFKNILDSDHMNWMNDETRRLAKQKMDAMRLEINSYSESNFSIEFQDLRIYPSDYIENLKNIKMLLSQISREKMDKPAELLEAGEILSYTPANMVFENKIKIPVSLLQPYYLWANTYPNAIKFGTIGTLVGHEIIHGFDDTGRKFDNNGNSKDWWDKKSNEAFEERLKCYIEQYHQYIYGGRPLPEMPNQSENVADNGGLRIAYEAYRTWYKTYARNDQIIKHERFPHLNFTSNQLFFISYAQLWCSDAHPSVLNLQASIDVHVPPKYRVIGPLSNFPQFSEAFNCPKGSKMNPHKKCTMY